MAGGTACPPLLAGFALHFPGDQESQFQSLLVVQARVNFGFVGARKIVAVLAARAADALGDVFPGKFQMHAA